MPIYFKEEKAEQAEQEEQKQQLLLPLWGRVACLSALLLSSLSLFMSFELVSSIKAPKPVEITCPKDTLLRLDQSAKELEQIRQKILQ